MAVSLVPPGCPDAVPAGSHDCGGPPQITLVRDGGRVAARSQTGLLLLRGVGRASLFKGRTPDQPRDKRLSVKH